MGKMGAALAAFLQILARASADKGFFGGVLLSFALCGSATLYGAKHVQAMHSEVVAQVEAQEKAITDLKAAQVQTQANMTVIQNTLTAITSAVKDVGEAVKRTDERTWQMLQMQRRQRESSQHDPETPEVGG